MGSKPVVWLWGLNNKEQTGKLLISLAGWHFLEKIQCLINKHHILTMIGSIKLSFSGPGQAITRLPLGISSAGYKNNNNLSNINETNLTHLSQPKLKLSTEHSQTRNKITSSQHKHCIESKLTYFG